MLYRKCPYCGANLDPSEICDCREKAAPGEQDREAAQVNDFTNNYIEISSKSQGGKRNGKKVGRNAEP